VYKYDGECGWNLGFGMLVKGGKTLGWEFVQGESWNSPRVFIILK
jgi:hypothetical protein